jgi:3-hydroxyisobutyrate dehydrogenase-like beta-hydroxyacid dehydrogenase
MGTPIAAHLVKAGHDLTVFDRSSHAVERAVAGGASAATSAAEAVAGTACAFLSLPGPDDVEEAVTGRGGVLDANPRPERIVDLSTNSPRMVRQLHERCAAVGVVFLDAPVSGGRIKAETGELSVLVGALDEDFTAVEPLLRCFAREIFHVGPCGTGTVAKLVNNQIFLAAGVLVQEAYVLGAAAGLDPTTLHQIIRASSAGPYTALAPLLLGRSFDDVIFRLDIATKDLSLAMEAAGEYGVEAPTTAGALSVYRDALEAGLGAEVFHATLKRLEGAAGIELPPLNKRKAPS